jgi:hypothetical protein
MLAAMTPMPLPARFAPNGAVPVADLARRMRELDTAALEVRFANPGKIISVYRSTPGSTIEVTELARAGRQSLSGLEWTLELSPVETVLILTGPAELLEVLGLVVPAAEAPATR